MTPLVLIQLAALGMGCGVIISSMTTKYRDLQMVVGFGVSLWSYMSPVAYDMFSRSVLAPGGQFYYLYMCICSYILQYYHHKQRVDATVVSFADILLYLFF